MKTILLITSLFAMLLLAACTKNTYKNDGGPSNSRVDMTTYDYLKSKPIFDSLVRMIDRAGLKDAVNGDITFFATANYGVADYIKYRKAKRDAAIGNENLPFNIDSLPASEMRDSMRVYMFPGKINREQMSVSGQLYDCALGPIPNVKFLIKLRRTRDYNQYVDYVDYVNFTKVIKTRDDQELDQSAIPDTEKDKSFDCQSSGIITTTGIVHVLSGSHRLFFNDVPLN